jgi:hypothetical protein
VVSLSFKLKLSLFKTQHAYGFDLFHRHLDSWEENLGMQTEQQCFIIGKERNCDSFLKKKPN